MGQPKYFGLNQFLISDFYKLPTCIHHSADAGFTVIDPFCAPDVVTGTYGLQEVLRAFRSRPAR